MLQLIKDVTDSRGADLTDEQFAQVATLANRRADSLLTQVQNFAESTGKGTHLTKENVIKTLSKRPWNADLKLICWKAGESFVKTSNHPSDIYGHIYAERKLWEIQQNENGGPYFNGQKLSLVDAAYAPFFQRFQPQVSAILILILAYLLGLVLQRFAQLGL